MPALRFGWLVLLIGASGTPPATAQEQPCTYEPEFHRMLIQPNGNTDTLRVGTGGAILHNDAPCEEATVLNTDLILLTGHTALVVRLDGGPLAPGFTVESSGTSEIEISANLEDKNIEVVGTQQRDHLVLGASGLNLNADDDADIAYEAGYAYLIGMAGDDLLSAKGGLRTGEHASVAVSLWGGKGDDRLVGGRQRTFIHAGSGRDTLLGNGGPDVLLGKGENDHLRGGPGNDDLSGGPGRDRCHDRKGRNEMRSCER
jgi:Ca2+-binding RTX toxin-like protein